MKTICCITVISRFNISVTQAGLNGLLVRRVVIFGYLYTLFKFEINTSSVYIAETLQKCRLLTNANLNQLRIKSEILSRALTQAMHRLTVCIFSARSVRDCVEESCR